MPHTYTNKNKIYSVDMMMAYVNLYKLRPIKVKLSELESELNYKGWGNIFDPYSAMEVLSKPVFYAADYQRIRDADLRYPIIMCNGRVVDGLHRLTKAHLERKKDIKAYILPEKLMQKFFLSSSTNRDKVDKMEMRDFIELFYTRFRTKK